MNDLADAVTKVAESARSVVQLEIQATLNELKRKLAAIGIGIGLALLALLLVALAIIFALIAAALGIHHWLSLWASFLVLSGAILVLALILAVNGLALMRRGSKRAPTTMAGENEQEA